MAFRLGIFIALILALMAGAFFGYSVLMESHKEAAAAATAPPPVTEQVIVASNNLQSGNLLQPADLTVASVPVNTAPTGAILDSSGARSALVGAMIRSSVTQGSPITESAVIHPGDHGFLAAVLAPGMRAVTIGVDAVSGAAGLIWPGDHVDIILTQTLNDPSLPVGQQIAAEVVLSNVRVIATDQQLGDATSAQAGNAAAMAVRPAATTVTLEVTTDEAQRCEVATKLGPLSLVVHSSESLPPDVDAKLNPPEPIWADQVSPILSNNHTNPPPVSTTVHVYGNADANGTDFKF